jgi:hypothetical protein
MDSVLQTALAEAVNSLASFFGTTTDTIMARAPEFLAKYGWYSTLNDLGLEVLLSVLLALLIMLIGWLIIGIGGGEVNHPVLIGIVIFVFCLAVCVGSKIVTCAVAPEIVGAHAILDLLKSAK